MSPVDSSFGSEAVSFGIRIAVEPVFDPGRSDPSRRSWFYLYTVTITNESDDIVQLVDRHWIITDEEGRVEEVRGAGVVGQQPILAPGESFEYTSACPLRTPSGSMRGSYRFVRADGTSFEAAIAEFILSEPLSVN